MIRRHDELVLPPRQTVSEWTSRALRSVFGRDTLAGIVLEEERPAPSRLSIWPWNP